MPAHPSLPLQKVLTELSAPKGDEKGYQLFIELLKAFKYSIGNYDIQNFHYMGNEKVIAAAENLSAHLLLKEPPAALPTNVTQVQDQVAATNNAPTIDDALKVLLDALRKQMGLPFQITFHFSQTPLQQPVP